MKKTLKITLFLAIFVCLLGLATSVQAYTANFTGTPTSVNSEGTFTVKITVDEATTIANSHIKYDSSLFTFVSSTQDNLSASIYQSEGEISWRYSDLSSNAKGVKTFEFTFKAKKVTEDKTGTFTITDAVFTTANNKTYQGTSVSGDKSIAVTVKAGSGNSTSSSANQALSILGTQNNTTTNGNSTNKTSTTSYNNTSDNTINKNKLPQTGENIARNGLIIAGIALIVIAVIVKIKSKKLFE